LLYAQAAQAPQAAQSDARKVLRPSSKQEWAEGERPLLKPFARRRILFAPRQAIVARITAEWFAPELLTFTLRARLSVFRITIAAHCPDNQGMGMRVLVCAPFSQDRTTAHVFLDNPMIFDPFHNLPL